MTIIVFIMAAIAGVSFAIQGPVNSALGKRTYVLFASVISFSGGAIVSGIITLLFERFSPSILLSARPWTIIGGMYGAISVFITISVMPRLGVALTVTASMLGQLVMSTIIDRLGLFAQEIIDVSTGRIIGIIVIIVGIILIYFGSGDKNDINSKSVLLLFTSFLGGVLGAIQNPTNAALAGEIGNFGGTFMSFLVGAIFLIIISLISRKGKIKPNEDSDYKSLGIKPWMYFGGLLGVIGIFNSIYTVTIIGAALQSACAMAGQVLGGMVIDSMGILEAKKVKVDMLRVVGIILIVVGIIIASGAI